MDFTKNQQCAIESNSQNIAILASAGSGKTLVLTERVCRIIKEGKAKPGSVLALTFTGKAAGEMKRRISQKLGAESKDIWIKTFHSYGLQLLRTYFAFAGLQDRFEIIGQGTKLQYVNRAVRESETFCDAKIAQGTISRIKNGSISCPQDFRAIFDAYNEMLRAANQIDVDDMVWLAVKLLRNNREVREAVSANFTHVFIDEFQDINEIQNELVDLTLAKDSSLCVVGDDDQCIYEWRGSRPEHIQELARRRNVERIYLTENFRSQKRIVEVANRLINHNSIRIKKEMVAQLRELAFPDFYRVLDEQNEAELISNIIHELCVENTYNYSQVAILTRTSKQMIEICDALKRRSIPYTKSSEKESNDFFEFLHVLYAILNVNFGTNIVKAVNFPKPVLDTFTYQDICEDNDWHGIRAQEAFGRIYENEDIVWDGGDIFRARYGKINGMRKALSDEPQRSTTDILEELLEFYHSEAKYESGEDKVACAEQCLSIAHEWQQTTGESSLSSFLDYVACAVANEELAFSSKAMEAVNVMTCHRSKGLEFPVVFVPGVQLGVFPNDDFIRQEEDIEPERRLLYVAMTRAKERLYITCYKNPYSLSKNPAVKQSFIAEMPELIEWRKIRRGYTNETETSTKKSYRVYEESQFHSAYSYPMKNDVPMHGYPAGNDTGKSGLEVCDEFIKPQEGREIKICYANCSDCPREKAGLPCLME